MRPCTIGGPACTRQGMQRIQRTATYNAHTRKHRATRARSRTRTRAHTRARADACSDAPTNTRACARRCMHRRTQTHAHARVHTRANTDARTHARTHAHARTHSYTHTHAHTRTGVAGRTLRPNRGLKTSRLGSIPAFAACHRRRAVSLCAFCVPFVCLSASLRVFARSRGCVLEGWYSHLLLEVGLCAGRVSLEPHLTVRHVVQHLH